MKVLIRTDFWAFARIELNYSNSKEHQRQLFLKILYFSFPVIPEACVFFLTAPQWFSSGYTDQRVYEHLIDMISIGLS